MQKKHSNIINFRLFKINNIHYCLFDNTEMYKHYETNRIIKEAFYKMLGVFINNLDDFNLNNFDFMHNDLYYNSETLQTFKETGFLKHLYQSCYFNINSEKIDIKTIKQFITAEHDDFDSCFKLKF